MAYNDIAASVKDWMIMNYQINESDTPSLVQYTEIYTHVYSCLQNDEIPHETTHHAAIAITEALSNYQLTVYKQTGSDVSANAVVDSVLGLF